MFLKKLAFIMFLMFLGTQIYSQTADDILQCMNKKLGKEYEADIKTQKIEMSMSMMGMDMPMTIFTSKPNKNRVEMSFMGMNVVTVITPEDCFMIQNGSVTDIPADQCKQSQERVEEQNMVASFGKLKKNSKAELDGKETVNGIPCNKLKITEENGDVGYFFIGEQDCLMHKFTSKMNLGAGIQDIEMLVTEYKEVGKMKIPYVMTMSSEGEEVGKIEIKNLEINIPISEDLFKRPK